MADLTATATRKVSPGPSEAKIEAIDVTSTGTSDTLTCSGFTTIWGLTEFLDGALNAGTANTFATNVITFAGHAGSGVWKLLVYGI